MTANNVDNWIGADRHLVATTPNQYGPPSVSLHKEANDLAATLPAGAVVLHTTVRPDGEQWHSAYVSMGAGVAVHAAIGSRRRKTLPDVIAEANEWHAKITAAADRNKRKFEAIVSHNNNTARQNGFAVGLHLGEIIPNTGKLMRAAQIVADHGDGTYDVTGTFGNKRKIIRRWDADGIEMALSRCQRTKLRVGASPACPSD